VGRDGVHQNRDRLLRGEVSQKFFEQIRAQAQAAGLLDDEHFTVDGTLLQACASPESRRDFIRTNSAR
jgi:hypothetical protein